MAKININIIHGENTVSIVKESENVRKLRDDVLKLFDLIFDGKKYRVMIGGGPISDHDKLKRIKAIRELTDYSLSEAKRLDDMLKDGYVTLPDYFIEEKDIQVVECFLLQYYYKVEFIEVLNV